jgi:hypothetical protein
MQFCCNQVSAVALKCRLAALIDLTDFTNKSQTVKFRTTLDHDTNLVCIEGSNALW